MLRTWGSVSSFDAHSTPRSLAVRAGETLMETLAMSVGHFPDSEAGRSGRLLQRAGGELYAPLPPIKGSWRVDLPIPLGKASGENRPVLAFADRFANPARGCARPLPPDEFRGEGPPAGRRSADRGQPGGRCAASCKLWFLPAIQGGRTRRLGT